MKCTTVLSVGLIASASAFIGPNQQSCGRPESTTARNALADRIFGLDLFAPNKDQNNYGARKSKDVKLGAITDKSYVPSGMTKAQYEKIRKEGQSKKEQNYAKNVKKAFQFTDYTEWYTKRGTDLNQPWKKSVTLGHSMAKTKYDWSNTDAAKKFESTKTDYAKKKATPVMSKKVAAKPAAKPAAKKLFSFF